jgi:hypothetical protein
MISHIKIYGERCSGTNYLEILILKNFKVNLIQNYGFKHFFGFNSFENSDNTLFICIIRHYHSWINSLYRKKWHLSPIQQKSKKNFLYSEHWSYYDDYRNHGENYGKEIMEDRDMYTQKRYNNIIELRYNKMKWMTKTLPKKVKHYIFIRYEDLLENFNYIMNSIYLKGVPLLSPKKFPENHTNYKNSKKKFIPSDENTITVEEIQKHPSFNFYLEKELLYY